MPRDVVATLDSMISERSLLKHPFYQAWTAGTLSLERLQTTPSNTIRMSRRSRGT